MEADQAISRPGVAFDTDRFGGDDLMMR